MRRAFLALALAWGLAAFAQNRPLLVAQEVYRVGGMDAPEWALFQDTTGMGFDAAGNLFVVDPSAHRVVVIGPDGELVRTIGREGEGPGEFDSPTEIAVWRDGRFAVLDLGHAAFQVFSPDGELERFVKLTNSSILLAMLRGTMLGIRADPLSSDLIAQGPPESLGRLMELMGQMFEEEEEVTSSEVGDRGLERLGLDGDVVSFTPLLQGWTAPRKRTLPELRTDDLLDPSRIAWVTGERYFEPGFHWDLLPDGTIAYSDSSAYAIKLVHPDGRVTDVLRRPLSPEVVTRGLREATVTRELRVFEERLNNPEVAGVVGLTMAFAPRFADERREEIQKREFLDEIPVVRGVRATWDGGLWVQRRGDEPWDDDGPIDVFNADREYVGSFAPGTLRMPSAFGPDGLVAFWETDELDVPTLVVERLPAELR